MEDVVLHYKSGPEDVISSLIQRTEKLLEPFPCRTPPVFSPWFPDRRPPIRPAKPAPVILSSDEFPVSNTHQIAVVKPPSGPEIPPESPPVVVSETPDQLIPVSPRPSAGKHPQKDRDVSPVRRSWSVFSHRGVPLHSPQPLSAQFGHMVSAHRLHLRQRVKWVIKEQNCGAERDIEQVWCSLTRSVLGSSLPTCNAHIRRGGRGRGEVWVFCDVLHCEQVGRFLKAELQLSGSISLSVHRRGKIFSL